MGMNDGGVKRGDRADTGDLEAQETETVDKEGSGARGGNEGATGVVTGQPSALGGGASTTGPVKLNTDKDSPLSNA